MSHDAYLAAGAAIVAAIIVGVLTYLKRDNASQSSHAEGNGQALNATGSGTAVNAGGDVHIGDKIMTGDGAVAAYKASANAYEAANHEYSLTPSPQDIVSAFSDHPPLQIESIVQHYIGLKVCWQLELEHIVSITAPMLSTPMSPEHAVKYVKVAGATANKKNPLDTLWPVVVCDVPLETYPHLKIMKKKSIYWVRGEINSVNTMTIDLRNARLEIPPTPAVT